MGKNFETFAAMITADPGSTDAAERKIQIRKVDDCIIDTAATERETV